MLRLIRVIRVFGLTSGVLWGLVATSVCSAQTLMHSGGPGNAIQLMATDTIVLDGQEVRKDLPCTVTPVKPMLGFDLRFHGGYDVSIPLRELAGEEDLLTILFRVIPAEGKGEPLYFSQKYTVPKIDSDARGDAYLQGGFDLGEGVYHVDWLVRDRMERVCSSNWDTTAALAPKDVGMKLTMESNSVEAADTEFFKQEPPVARIDNLEPFKVKVLINFAPQRMAAASIQPLDTSALVSILRNISREPRICKFSIVAFNMNEQRVVYKRDDTDQIDFPELGKALTSLKPGTVDYKNLTNKHGDTEFLTKLIESELSATNADAVIFAGPKVMLDEAVSQENLKQFANASQPVFYMNFNLYPQQMPWRDAIGNAVKHMRGMEYTITRPRDLWTAWTDIMGRIVKLKLVRTSAASSQ